MKKTISETVKGYPSYEFKTSLYLVALLAVVIDIGADEEFARAGHIETDVAIANDVGQFTLARLANRGRCPDAVLTASAPLRADQQEAVVALVQHLQFNQSRFRIQVTYRESSVAIISVYSIYSIRLVGKKLLYLT